jgi:hypothetical protein
MEIPNAELDRLVFDYSDLLTGREDEDIFCRCGKWLISIKLDSM